ncbi:SusC/RagA family TonB-linked outer membrane protein [Flexithrix dorotheae]|uniref:SusC/RagA family TonB-linked outer membrane protein n=1 Tax=Flexithrix dorotheae TaxID=70993 RepID=UPI00146F2EFE|nr:TonB-dependent receptor [Flexithrix dorotheae]
MIYFKPMARQVLLFIFCWVSFQGLFAQSTISGKVTSSEDSQPIPGVNILIKGTSNGTTTNFDGEFKLSANPGETLIFSYIGYINQEIEISSQTQLDIVLEPDMQQLEEVVVVGYGTQKKADLTGSVSSISGDEISKMSSPRIEQALMGKTAGVQISAVDASPGAGLSIKIRGDNSINANNEPLVVIDGFIGGDLRSLNTNDVESIEVLKDASATAIYGSRGSNGVIIVTTKSGKSGKTEVSLTAEYGFQKLNKKLDLMNGTEYWALRRLNSADLDPTAWEVTNIDTLGAGTDWQDEIIQDAPIKRYNARITGGNEKTRYAAFIDYIDQAGIVKNSDYSKGSVRLNLDHDISDKARFGARISYYKSTENGARINGNYGSRGGPITLNATIFPSIIPVYAEDGSYNPLFDSSSQRDNPVHTADKTIDETFRNYLQGSGFFEYDIIDGLTYKLNMGYLFQTREQRRYVSKTLQAALNEGSADLDNVYSNRWLIENTLNYRKSFNDHDLNILAGFTSQVDNTNRNDISTTGFATEVLNLNDIGLAENVVNKGSSYSQVNQASFLGRINYGYKGKYLVTLTGRSDGSSVFAKNNKWAFFPSASFGWRISEESFMNTSNTFSNLKLRLSYGKSGNQAISPYQSLASYNTGVIYTIDGSTQLTNGVVPGRISNADLRWETTAQTNVGLDMGFLQDRLGFTVDVYRKLTNDLLYNARLAPNSGFSSQLQNIGEVENRGVELSVNAQVVKSGDFTFDVSGNISFVDNKVLSLGEDSVVYLNTSGGSMGSGYSTTGVLEIGQPMGNFFGYVFDGIYQNEQEVAALPFPGAIPGAAKYRDINGDGEINEDDRTTIGNALPNVYYGFTTNFAYKGLDLNIVFQGVKGAEMAYLGKVNLLRPGSQNNGFKEVQDYWTPENGSNTMVGIGETWDEMSSRFVESADFLRVRNISLGYTLPKTVSQKIGAKNLRVYANAINWFTFTNYSGFDPEVNSRHNGSDFQQNVQRGVDNGGYPSAKQFLMGINLTF